ncbi:MAG: DUF4293 family protein [Flavobacteriaceae bacterium]|jgi:hypothetical protein
MIQRKQTLFWLVDLLLVVLVFFLGPKPEFQLSQLALVPPWFDLLFGGATLLNLLSIVFYNRRLWQLRINRLHIVVKIVWISLELISLYQVGFGASKWYVFLVLPVVGVFLLLAAQKGVKQDEALVRSIDRIR